ncbi:hypothetical protein ACFQY0_08260 [Haloferula chungangensis]|uniref:Roadblock/LC7 domain-containing protein n=1 Tax=Haloferula chungangensis TaxID=1048331 RepID=A0ABW2L789_9BACT
MDPVEPWIDGNAVRRLAAELLSAPKEAEISESPDAGFGPGFEGFTSNAAEAPVEPAAPVVTPPPLPATAVRPERVEVPKEKAPEKKALQENAPSPAPESTEPEGAEASQGEPEERRERENSAAQAFRIESGTRDDREGEGRRGPLMDRMERFRDWLIHHTGARSVFVLDREGQAVLDDRAYAKLHFLARSLSQAYRPVPGQPGNVHVKVGSDAFLVVIPVETAIGYLVLGTVLPKPLDASSVEIVAKVLVDSARQGGA